MNKQKGLAPILIVLLIALAVGGYLLYQKQTKPVVSQPVTQSLANPTTSPVASNSAETANPDSIPIQSGSIGANWKTYTNNKLGYSFNYPPTWLNKSDDIDHQQDIVRLSFIEQGKEYFMFVGAKERGGPTADEIKGDNLTFNGISFSRKIWTKAGKPFFIVVTPDQSYSVAGHIEFNIPQDNVETYLILFNQILSTFKFTQ